MSIKFEKGGTKAVAQKNNVEAIVKRSFSAAVPAHIDTSTNPKSIPVYYDGSDRNEIIECYKNALNIAKDNNINSIVFPLLGAQEDHFSMKELWRIATDAILENGDNITVYLAIDNTTAEKISNSLPEVADIPNTATLTQVLASNSMPGCSYLITANTRRDLDDEVLRVEQHRQTVAELFHPYLNGRSIGNIASDVAGIMSQAACYNILSYRDKPAKPRNLVALGLVLGLSFDEFNRIYQEAGYSFRNTVEDAIYKIAFKNGLDLCDVDQLLFEHDLTPLTE